MFIYLCYCYWLLFLCVMLLWVQHVLLCRSEQNAPLGEWGEGINLICDRALEHQTAAVELSRWDGDEWIPVRRMQSPN